MRLRTLGIFALLVSGVVTFAQTAPPATGPAAMPEGAGKAIVQKSCVGCHTLGVVTSKRASHKEWEQLVNQMVSRGADLTDDEVTTVIEYLAKNYGPLDQKPADSASPAK